MDRHHDITAVNKSKWMESNFKAFVAVILWKQGKSWKWMFVCGLYVMVAFHFQRISRYSTQHKAVWASQPQQSWRSVSSSSRMPVLKKSHKPAWMCSWLSGGQSALSSLTRRDPPPLGEWRPALLSANCTPLLFRMGQSAGRKSAAVLRRIPWHDAEAAIALCVYSVG